MYELAGTTLLVVTPEERVRSEIVLDLFLQGACVLVAEEADEALEVLRAVRVDCVLASPQLAPGLRARAEDEGVLGAPPVVTMTPPSMPEVPPSIEA